MWHKILMMVSVVAAMGVVTVLPSGLVSGGGKAHMLEVRQVEINEVRTVRVTMYGLDDGERVRLSHECFSVNQSVVPSTKPVTLTYEPLQTAKKQFIYGGVASWDVQVDATVTDKRQNCPLTVRQVVGGGEDSRKLFVIEPYTTEHSLRRGWGEMFNPDHQQAMTGTLEGDVMTVTWEHTPTGLWQAMDDGASIRLELVTFHQFKDSRKDYEVTKLHQPATTVMYLDGAFVKVPGPTTLVWTQVDDDVKVCESHGNHTVDRSGELYLDIHYRWRDGKRESHRATVDC